MELKIATNKHSNITQTRTKPRTKAPPQPSGNDKTTKVKPPPPQTTTNNNRNEPTRQPLYSNFRQLRAPVFPNAPTRLLHPLKHNHLPRMLPWDARQSIHLQGRELLALITPPRNRLSLLSVTRCREFPDVTRCFSWRFVFFFLLFFWSVVVLGVC